MTTRDITTEQDLDEFLSDAGEAYYFAVDPSGAGHIVFCSEDGTWLATRPLHEGDALNADGTYPGGMTVPVEGVALPLTLVSPGATATSPVWEEITHARARAHAKHGAQSIEALDGNDPRWLSILVEEVGEVATELTYDATGSLRAELLDVLSVASAWVDAIDGDAAARRVHNHGAEEGAGLSCPERVLVDGSLRGACIPTDIPTRTWTPNHPTPTGGQVIKVKRACSGCGEHIGDPTQEELDALVSGAPLPSTTEEHGCQR